MSNLTPPRIEREAIKYSYHIAKTCYYPVDNWETTEVAEREACSGYQVGAEAEHARAAPVVKALEDRLKEWEAGYQAECAAIDRINKGRRKPSFRAGEDYKMNYPPIPHWVTEAKQILETYKADV
jgi:hypothetical protein